MNPSPPPSRLAYALLAALTVFSFGGPFVLMLVIGGGQNPKWPPDRPVEWLAFVTIVSIVCILLALCVSIRWWMPRLNASGSATKKPSIPGQADR